MFRLQRTDFCIPTAPSSCSIHPTYTRSRPHNTYLLSVFNCCYVFFSENTKTAVHWPTGIAIVSGLLSHLYRLWLALCDVGRFVVGGWMGVFYIFKRLRCCVRKIHRNKDFHFPPHRSKRSVLCYVPGNSVCGGERECGEVQGGDGWQYRVF